MDDVAWARRAATDALADIQPAGLRERAETFLADGSTAPAVLTLVSARAVDADIDREVVAERAAGVQLIYEGLDLTRGLSRDEPWTDPTLDSEQADLDVLVADVLVARGFYLLARTEAAQMAVETVRTFGREQTNRLQNDVNSVEQTLEESVLSLAALAGMMIAGRSCEALIDRSADLASDHTGGLPPVETVLDAETREALKAQV